MERITKLLRVAIINKFRRRYAEREALFASGEGVASEEAVKETETKNTLNATENGRLEGVVENAFVNVRLGDDGSDSDSSWGSKD